MVFAEASKGWRSKDPHKKKDATGTEAQVASDLAGAGDVEAGEGMTGLRLMPTPTRRSERIAAKGSSLSLSR